MSPPEAAAIDTPTPTLSLAPAAGEPGAGDVGSRLAAAVKDAASRDDHAMARERFADLIGLYQRRANRIALAYLRNPADADEAVQDAFVRVYTNIQSYRDELPFDQWFTRILVNRCIDRERARLRRERRLTPLGDDVVADDRRGRGRSPEQRLLGRRWRSAVTRAVDTLPDRQRSVFVLCHYADLSPAEVSTMTGLRESTVRVHLFRAVRKLRAALEDWREAR